MFCTGAERNSVYFFTFSQRGIAHSPVTVPILAPCLSKYERNQRILQFHDFTVNSFALPRQSDTFKSNQSKPPPRPSRCHLFPLYARFDEVSVEGDVDVDIITVDGVLPLPLVQTDPHLVAQLQPQHQALTLHDGAVAGLGVHDGLLRVVVHDV